MLRNPNLPGKTVGDRRVIEITGLEEELTSIAQEMEKNGREISAEMSAILGMVRDTVSRLNESNNLELLAIKKDNEVIKSLAMEAFKEDESLDKVLTAIENVNRTIDKNANKYIEYSKIAVGFLKEKAKEKVASLAEQFVGGLHPIYQQLYKAGQGGISLYKQFKEKRAERDENIRNEFSNRIEAEKTVDKTKDIETTARDITDVQKISEKANDLERKNVLDETFHASDEKQIEFMESFQEGYGEELKSYLEKTAESSEKLPEVLTFLQDKDRLQDALANEVQRIAADKGKVEDLIQKTMAEHPEATREEVEAEVRNWLKGMTAEASARSSESTEKITDSIEKSSASSSESIEQLQNTITSESRSSFADKEKEEVYRRESLEATRELAKSIDVLKTSGGKSGSSGGAGGATGGGGIIDSIMQMVGDNLPLDKVGRFFKKNGLGKVFERFGQNKVFSLGKSGAEKVAEKSVERIGGTAVRKGVEQAPKSFGQAVKETAKTAVKENVDKAKEVGKVALQKGKEKAADIASKAGAKVSDAAAKVGAKAKDIATPVIDKTKDVAAKVGSKAKNAAIKAGTPYIEATKQVFSKGGAHAAKTLAANGLKMGVRVLPGVGTAMTVYEIMDMAHEYNKENIKAYTDLNEFDSNVSAAQGTENSMGYDLTSAFDDSDVMEGIELTRSAVEERDKERRLKEYEEKLKQEKIDNKEAYENAIKRIALAPGTDDLHIQEDRNNAVSKTWRKLTEEQKKEFIDQGLGYQEMMGAFGGHDPKAAIQRVAYNEKVLGNKGETYAELVTPEAVERAKRNGIIASDLELKREAQDIMLTRTSVSEVSGLKEERVTGSQANANAPFIYQPVNNNTYITNPSGDSGNKMPPAMRNPMPASVANGEGVTTISVR